MISLTEKILFQIRRDGTKICSSKDLEEYMEKFDLISELKKQAKDDFEFFLNRIYEVIKYFILMENKKKLCHRTNTRDYMG